jgi:hypothetical protein
MARASVHRDGNRLVVEGLFSSGKKGDKGAVRVLVCDAATGREQYRWDLPGEFDDEGMVLAADNAVAFLTSTGVLLDTVNGVEWPPMDVEMQSAGKEGVEKNVTLGPYRMSQGAGHIFLTSQARNLAMRLWAKDGRLGYAHVWESNYGNSGFNNVAAPAVATEKFLFVSHSVLEHTPHMPDPRAEIIAYDVNTGRPLARLKPALDDLYSYGALNIATPTVAGEYLFLLAGRANNTRNQIAIATADEHLQLIARNDVEPGTTAPPVFAGHRMFLRSPASLTCVAVTSEDGRRYQSAALAKTLLRTVGTPPISAKPVKIAGLDKVNMAGDVPIGKLMDGRPTEFWLGAGPLSKDTVDAMKLPDIEGVKWTPQSREFAYNQPPYYHRSATLQGTGDLVPRFQTDVDPRGVSGPEGTGLLYTVLDNPRDRIVLPVTRARGVTQWLGGQLVEPDKPLHLRPGLYPYLLRVDPEYYRVEEFKALTPIAVTNALAAGVLRDVGWPKTWQVLGPMPADAAPLEGQQLREIPRSVMIGETEYPLIEFPALNGKVNLNSLAGVAPGQKPDFANAPATVSLPDTTRACAFAVVDCPADGYLYIGAGCDWYMRWFVDGVAIHREELAGGNLGAHSLAARVTKGRHVVAVEVRPGSKGWSFASVGGFSEKSGEELPTEYRVAVKEKPSAPDFRLQPCFREIPHPPTLESLWRERATRNRSRLEAIVRESPGTEEARQAADLLAKLK